jgi:hypothetical protein
MHSLERIQSELLRLKWHVAALRFERAMQRHALALKAGFNPDQPRDELGRWTDAGGEDFETDDGDSEGFDKSEDRYSTDISAVRRKALPPIEDPSQLPALRPETTQEINRIAREISRNPYLAAYYFLTIAESVGHWLNEKHWEIKAHQDPPKTLDELHDAVSLPDKRGYDDHNIVEQTAARNQGVSQSQINGRDNVVRIPRYKHWEINSWYQTPNVNFDGMTPRAYLQGKSWAEHRRVGLDAMRDVGVLR